MCLHERETESRQREHEQKGLRSLSREHSEEEDSLLTGQEEPSADTASAP